MKKSCVLICFLMIVCLLYSQVETTGKILELHDYKVAINYNESTFKEDGFEKNQLTSLNSILKNVELFDIEQNNNYFFKNASIEIFIDGNKLLSELTIKAFSGTGKFARSYVIKNIKFYADFKVSNMEIFLPSPKDKPENDIFIYRLYNIRTNKKWSSERIILKLSETPVFSVLDEGAKFIEGKLIQYGQLNPQGNSTSYRIKTFILTRSGKKIFTKIKESLNRSFNDKGLIQSEAVRETRYSYAMDDSHYSIYNLSLFDDGNIRAYDLILADLHEASFDNIENYEFKFLEYNKRGFLLNKVIKRFLIKDAKKQYVSGREILFKRSENNSIIFSKEMVFNYTENGKPEKEPFKRYYNKGIYNFDITNDKRKRLSEKLLKTYFAYQDDKEFEYVEDYREVVYFFQNHQLKGFIVTFYDFDFDYNKKILREISIDFVEFMQNKEPSMIDVKIKDSSSGADVYQQTIIQDCSYTINEAIYGNLFSLPMQNNKVLVDRCFDFSKNLE